MPQTPSHELAVQDLRRRSLGKDGFRVEAAADGRKGLELAKRLQPAVIVLDLLMPEMDGFEFMAALLQRPDAQHLPVIVITAKDLTEEDQRRLNGGVERIVQKGATSQGEVLDLVRTLLTGKTDKKYKP